MLVGIVNRFDQVRGIVVESVPHSSGQHFELGLCARDLVLHDEVIVQRIEVEVPGFPPIHFGRYARAEPARNDDVDVAFLEEALLRERLITDFRVLLRFRERITDVRTTRFQPFIGFASA